MQFLTCFSPLMLWITLFKFSLLFLITLTALYCNFPSFFMTSKYSMKWMYSVYLTSRLLLDITLISIFCFAYKQFLNCPNILNKCHSSKRTDSKTTVPAVVWNCMESTLILNFIFSLDFLFLEPFFPINRPFLLIQTLPVLTLHSLPGYSSTSFSDTTLSFLLAPFLRTLSFAFIHSPFDPFGPVHPLKTTTQKTHAKPCRGQGVNSAHPQP